ncbi:MAG TPA: hypothetical protein VFI71_05785, partial [Pyrinomonadaceae bacterium]|nr:hypothetical protein [Pyrinomonadaceae bacterium]
WDQASNITLVEDNVHVGFDVSYTNDDLNRLSRAQEGTWNGSSITSEKRDQEWTLTHTGNWELDKLDLTGDNDWGDANEHQDDRTHNEVNELTARDTDDNGSDNFTLSYDEAGNLIDDGENYKYVYDVFYRLRKVLDRSDDSIVAEYKYNGNGHQISIHEDTDTDGDVDGSDKWFHMAYDEAWRPVAIFRESDTSPKEEYVLHQAGYDGMGGSSYINAVICRDRDHNTAWTTASDTVLERRDYFCQNWRGDVSVLIKYSGAATMAEWAKFTSYGIPIGLPFADADSDGDRDLTDVSTINALVSYDVRGDIDLDGDNDSTDETLAGASTSTMGLFVLSDVGSRCGYAGYVFDEPLSGAVWHVRHRVLDSVLGRWLRRDSLSYLDAVSLYVYSESSPVANLDP